MNRSRRPVVQPPPVRGARAPLARTAHLTGLATAACLVLISPAGAWADESPPTRRGAASPRAAAPVQAAADACRTTTSDTDLNGDGYDDAVVGDPYATVSGRAGAGAVVVLYGDADGRIGEGHRDVLTQASVPGSHVEAGDHFGWSVAVDDATGDGCADILVGSPDEDWAGHRDAGIAHLISFTPDGRGGPGTAQAVVADQGDVAGAVESGDQFGYAVALSNYRGDDERLGAIGAPGEDLRGLVDAGVVNTFSQLGSPSLADQREQGRLGGRWLPGTAEAGDRFGASVMIAPLQAVSGSDTGVEPTVVAGAPGDIVHRAGSTAVHAGSITAWDPVTGFSQVATQDSPDVPGTAEEGDQFGYSLAFCEPATTPGAAREVVVGAPGEDVGSARDAGAVTLFADIERLGLEGRRTFTQDTTGFDGTAEAGDRFGHSVALRPVSGPESLLVIGTPDENVGSVVDAGMAQTVTVDSTSDTYRPGGGYTENTAGTPGRVARGSHFGLTVAAMSGRTESVFTVSSPYSGAGSVFVVDDAGRTRSWVPGVAGVPKLVSGRFGWSVAGLGSEQ